eukprot:TRINITY_DN25972_c0_g1_i1.p1 TRINITY_DN25972_c0_g1~~TRINITY_DN25972_c0_g1_i1.p1  ORF type:complete len:769 (+),score=240.81 TRINITY_DN25972_c0_g1_i1:216-2309(+)
MPFTAAGRGLTGQQYGQWAAQYSAYASAYAAFVAGKGPQPAMPRAPGVPAAPAAANGGAKPSITANTAMTAWVQRCLQPFVTMSDDVRGQAREILRSNTPPREQWDRVQWATWPVPPDITNLLRKHNPAAAGVPVGRGRGAAAQPQLPAAPGMPDPKRARVMPQLPGAPTVVGRGVNVSITSARTGVKSAHPVPPTTGARLFAGWPASLPTAKSTARPVQPVYGQPARATPVVRPPPQAPPPPPQPPKPPPAPVHYPVTMTPAGPKIPPPGVLNWGLGKKQVLQGGGGVLHRAKKASPEKRRRRRSSSYTSSSSSRSRRRRRRSRSYSSSYSRSRSRRRRRRSSSSYSRSRTPRPRRRDWREQEERAAEERRKEARRTRFAKLRQRQKGAGWDLPPVPKSLSGVGEVFAVDNAVAIIGTSQELEKVFMRSAACMDFDPRDVRPQEVLEKSLELVMKKKEKKQGDDQRTYCYEQLKSIRQDLTVQHIFNKFTTKVYETHARVCLKHGDVGEFNACQAKLRAFHKVPDMVESEDHVHEFTAYRLMYCALTHSISDLSVELGELTDEQRKEPTVQHAVLLIKALFPLNITRCRELYYSAPNLGKQLLDMFLPPPRGLRMEIYPTVLRAYRPAIDKESLRHMLLFTADKTDDEAFQEFLDFVKAATVKSGAINTTESMTKFREVQVSLNTRKDFAGDGPDS